MAVGGIVLSLSPDPSLGSAVEAWIRNEPRLEVGPREGQRLALVAITDSLGEGRDLCEALLNQPGVLNLEVAYVAPEDVALEGVAPEDAPVMGNCTTDGDDS